MYISVTCHHVNVIEPNLSAVNPLMTSSTDIGITAQDITASWNNDINNPTLNKISFCLDQVNYKYCISH